MELTELENDFLTAYRMLSDKEKLAVRRYLNLGDKEMLRRFLQERGDQSDDLIPLSIAQSNNHGALFGA